VTPRQIDFLILLGLGIAWALAASFVGLRGEFPLNDDWAYEHSTRFFLETGQIKRLAWTWATIVTHVWAGALASHWFGLSFETLRLVGILSGFGASAASYALGRSCGLGPARSALVAIIVAICPVHFNLAFTYMTDGHFAFWVTTGLAAFAWGVHTNGPRRTAAFAFAVVAVVLATLVRQPGASVAVAILAALALARIRTLPQFTIATSLTLVAILVAFSLSDVLTTSNESGRSMLGYLLKRVLASPHLIYFLAVNSLVVFVYLGWFLGPIAPFVAPPRNARGLKGAALAAAIVVPLASSELRGDWPPGVNLIWNFGLGVRTLDGWESLPQAPVSVWWALTALGAASSTWCLGSLAISFALRIGELRERSELWVLLFFPALFISVLALRLPFFDRYLIAVLPALAVAALTIAGRPAAQVGHAARTTAAIACTLLAAYSILGTRDYMERHRNRQILLDQQLAAGISPRRIDGGFEFNGRHNFDRNRNQFLEGERRWVYDDEFVVTYSASREGYRSLRSLEYRRWIPPGREQIHLLERIRTDATDLRHLP